MNFPITTYQVPRYINLFNAKRGLRLNVSAKFMTDIEEKRSFSTVILMLADRSNNFEHEIGGSPIFLMAIPGLFFFIFVLSTHS